MDSTRSTLVACLVILLSGCCCEVPDRWEGVPDKPATNLSVTPGYKLIDVQWQAINGAIGYDIYYGFSSMQGVAPENFASIPGISSINVAATPTRYVFNVPDNQLDSIYYFTAFAKFGQGVDSRLDEDSTQALSILTINDTGIDWSGNYPQGNNASCSSGTGLTPGTLQDCNFGRDSTGTTNEDSDGYAGFRYTKLNQQGTALSSQTVAWDDLGSEADNSQWSCVLDENTGLVWEVKQSNNGLHHSSRTYRWGGISALGRDADIDITVKGIYYDDWNELVDGSNESLLCGRNDWRAPTLFELNSIVYNGKSNQLNPAIDNRYFPNTEYDTLTSNKIYWSNTPFAENVSSDEALSINFGRGVIFKSKRQENTQNYLRLVAGPAIEKLTTQEQPELSATQIHASYIPNFTPNQRYVSTNNLSVLDLRTGLMWQKCTVGLDGDECSIGVASTHTWKTALELPATINQLNFAGFNDWRLPNKNELLTLIAPDRLNPAINTRFFANTPLGKFWTSSPDAHFPTLARKVAFDNIYQETTGERDLDGVHEGGSPSYVRLVRNYN